jgi:hypothetical protein
MEELVSYDDYEPIDAFIDRFERLIDFLSKQIFRSIYYIETLDKENPTLKQLLLFMNKI